MAANEEILQQRRRENVDSAGVRRCYWRDEIPGFWERVTLGIAATGTTVLFVLGCIGLIGSLVRTGLPSFEALIELATAASAGLLILVLVFFVLRVVALIVAVYASKVLESLEMQTDRLPVATLVGAVSGLLTTFPFVVSALSNNRILPGSFVAAGAAIVCQIGAGVAAHDVLRINKPNHEATSRFPRFSLRYLIVSLLAISIILGILKAASAPLMPLMKFLGMWIVLVLAAELVIYCYLRIRR